MTLDPGKFPPPKFLAKFLKTLISDQKQLPGKSSKNVQEIKVKQLNPHNSCF